jgi:hypothetical protein
MKTVSFVAALLLILALAAMPATAAKKQIKSGGNYKGGHYESGDNSQASPSKPLHHDKWIFLHRSERNIREILQSIGNDWNKFAGSWDDWDQTWDNWDDSWDSGWVYKPNEDKPDKEYILTQMRELVDRAHADGLTPIYRQIGHIRDSRVWEEDLATGHYVVFLAGGANVNELALRVSDTLDYTIAEDDESNAKPAVWFDINSKQTVDITAKVLSFYGSSTNDYVGMLLCYK